jgi:hypothetical protein
VSELTAAQRSMRARMGGLATASRHDTKKLTKPARAAFDQRFVDQVDPDRVLPEAERARRAAAARKAYFTRLAFASAKARRRRAS